MSFLKVQETVMSCDFKKNSRFWNMTNQKESKSHGKKKICP